MILYNYIQLSHVRGVNMPNNTISSAGITQALSRFNRAAQSIASPRGNSSAIAAINKGLENDSRTYEATRSNVRQNQATLREAEGSLQEGREIVSRLKELATKANNGSLNSTQRQTLNQEAQQLVDQYKQTVERAESPSGAKLFDGSYNKNTQVGLDAGDTVNTQFSDISASNLNLNTLDLANNPSQALQTLEAADNTLSAETASVGATQSRLDKAADNIDTTSLATQEAAQSTTSFVDSVLELQGAEQSVNANIAVTKFKNNLDQQTVDLLKDKDK